MHQSIPSIKNSSGQPPGFCANFQPGIPGFVPFELLGSSPGVTPGLPGVGLIIYYQSTKLSVNAIWRHFSDSNWSIICCCSLVSKSVSKLGENFITLNMVWLGAFQFFLRFDFCKNSKIFDAHQQEKLTRSFKTRKFCPGHGFWPPQKNFPRGLPGGRGGGGKLVLGIDWCITWHRLPALQISMPYDVWIKFYREDWKDQSMLRDKKPSAYRSKRSFYP